MVADGEAPVASADARRLHPATVAIDVLRGAPQTIVIIPAAVAIFSRVGLLTAIGIALLLVAGTSIVRWLAWRRFTYTLTDDAVVIQSGILSRNRRTIPFDRVQDVNIVRKPLARLFGLAEVTMETGGAGSDEASLDSVSMAEAERLRAVIRRRAAAAGRADQAAGADEPARDATSAAEADAPVLFSMGLPRLALWGLYNFSLVWLAVIFAGLQYLDTFLPFDFLSIGYWIGEDRQVQVGRAEATSWALLALPVFLVLGVIAGLTRTISKEFGFTLTDQGGRYRRIRGLFTRHEAVIALARVQLALVSAGPLMRLTGWWGLRLQTLGGSGDEGGRQEAAPFARPDEVATLLVPLNLARPDPATLRPVAGGHVVRSLLRGAVPPLIPMTAATLFLPFGWLAFLALPGFVTLALLQRRTHRYHAGEDTLAVESGVLTRRQWIVPKRNVQAISIRQGPLQRLLGTATVFPDTAGGSVLSGPAVEDVRTAHAWALARALR